MTACNRDPDQRATVRNTGNSSRETVTVIQGVNVANWFLKAAPIAAAQHVMTDGIIDSYNEHIRWKRVRASARPTFRKRHYKVHRARQETVALRHAVPSSLDQLQSSVGEHKDMLLVRGEVLVNGAPRLQVKEVIQPCVMFGGRCAVPEDVRQVWLIMSAGGDGLPRGHWAP